MICREYDEYVWSPSPVAFAETIGRWPAIVKPVEKRFQQSNGRNGTLSDLSLKGFI